ncbi:MAG: hypothetical protein IPH20_24635 [Bacteroidales bacterium]|nr:hypothetical protein [Bacteroidales bacterium]
MEYNWTEIFKNKSTRELYNIYLGKSALGSEQGEYARIELENRKFDFENLDKQRRKWELENLIEEEKSYNSIFFRSYRSWEHLIMGIIGLVFTSISLILLLRHYLTGKQTGDLAGTFFALIFGLAFTIIGFVNYRKKRAREIFRKNRLRELIDKL